MEDYAKKMVQSAVGKKPQNKPVPAAKKPEASPSEKMESQNKSGQQAKPEAKLSQETASHTTKDVDDMSEALLKAKGKLKPTETVVRPHPVVGTGGRESNKGKQYNIEDEDAKREFFDDAKQLDSKVKQVAKWLRESKHAIIFTGAGVSTSAGIPDFRSGMNTVLSTGPGVWELRAQDSVPTSKRNIVPILRVSICASGCVLVPNPPYLPYMHGHKN